MGGGAGAGAGGAGAGVEAEELEELELLEDEPELLDEELPVVSPPPELVGFSCAALRLR